MDGNHRAFCNAAARDNCVYHAIERMLIVNCDAYAMKQAG